MPSSARASCAPLAGLSLLQLQRRYGELSAARRLPIPLSLYIAYSLSEALEQTGVRGPATLEAKGVHVDWSGRVGLVPTDARRMTIHSPSSQVFQVGALLRELMTGPGQTGTRALETSLRPLRELNPHVSPALEQLVLKAMAPSASERMRDLPSLRAALRSQMTARPEALQRQLAVQLNRLRAPVLDEPMMPGVNTPEPELEPTEMAAWGGGPPRRTRRLTVATPIDGTEQPAVTLEPEQEVLDATEPPATALAELVELGELVELAELAELASQAAGAPAPVPAVSAPPTVRWQTQLLAVMLVLAPLLGWWFGTHASELSALAQAQAETGDSLTP